MISVSVPASCTLCPRKCGVNRTQAAGFCGAGPALRVARAALHLWEEPCISGTRGSGTVFFSGCSLQCCYCQNYPISAEGFGKDITPQRLSEIFLHLQQQGAHNINLVTPTQWLPWILPALQDARSRGLQIPIVYNTGGYETLETVQAMIHAVPKPVLDENGLMQKGVILRHLALPGHTDDSFAVLDWMATLPAGSFLLSLMSQYTPFYKGAEHGLGRRITTYEYRKVVQHALSLGLDTGFMQEKSSAREEYTPPFDLEGV